MTSMLRPLVVAALAARLMFAIVPAAAAAPTGCVATGIVTLGAPFTVADSAGEVSSSAATWNPDRDEYLAIWHYYANGEHRLDGQRLAADGTPIGASFPIAHDPNAISDPIVATAPGHDEYLVVWQTQSDPFNGARGIVLAGDGTAGDVFVISAAGSEPEVVYLPTAQKFFFSGRGLGIQAQLIDLDGSLSGDAITLATVDDGSAAPNGQAAVNAAGQVLALWRDQENDLLAGRRVSADGSVVGAITTYANEFPSSGRAGYVDYRAADDHYVALYGLFDQTALRWLSVDADGVGSTPTTVLEGDGLTPVAVAYDTVSAASLLLWTHYDETANVLTLSGQLVSAAGQLEGTPTPLIEQPGYGFVLAPVRERSEALIVWQTVAQLQGQRIAYGCTLRDAIFANGFD